MSCYLVERRLYGRENTIQWHIGQPRLLEPKEIDCIEYIQADCDELEHINNMFPGFAIRNRVVAIWYGDVARTIAANL